MLSHPRIPTPASRLQPLSLPPEPRIPQRLVLGLGKIQVHQIKVIVQHIGILLTTPLPILIDARLEYHTRVSHLLLKQRLLWGGERWVPVFLVEGEAGQGLEVAGVGLVAGVFEVVEGLDDLVAGLAEDPFAVVVVNAVYAFGMCGGLPYLCQAGPALEGLVEGPLEGLALVDAFALLGGGVADGAGGLDVLERGHGRVQVMQILHSGVGLLNVRRFRES